MNDLASLIGYFAGMGAIAVIIIFRPQWFRATWGWCHDRMESLLRLLRII